MKITQRTQKEIVQRVKRVIQTDMFGFEVPELIGYLDYEHAKEFLKEGVTEKDWSKDKRLTPKEQIEDYMWFAWEKANNKRGISAYRSMLHMRAWIWLDDPEFFNEIDSEIEDFEYYGKDVLVKICKHYGLDYTQWDDGKREN